MGSQPRVLQPGMHKLLCQQRRHIPGMHKLLCQLKRLGPADFAARRWRASGVQV